MHSEKGSFQTSLHVKHSYEEKKLLQLHNSSSFVLVNNKRSWRPPASTVCDLISFFPSGTPIAFVVANPGVRLHSERTHNSGFVIQNYSIAVTHDAWDLNCERANETTFVEQDANAFEKDDQELVIPYGSSRSLPYRSWSDHSYPCCGFDKRMKYFRHPNADKSETANTFPSSCCAHNASSSEQIYAFSDQLGNLRELEERCCYQGAAPEVALCVSVECNSFKGLQMALRSIWWLRRYYGVSLTVKRVKKDQLLTFKTIQKALALRQLVLCRATLTEDWLQVISDCSELLSLSIVDCTTTADIEMQHFHSILNSNKQKSGKLSWYLSGFKGMGLLSKLKCLHLINTTLTAEFIASLEQCQNLQCVLFHKVKGGGPLNSLKLLPDLRAVSLSSSFFEYDEMQPLGECRNLAHLVLEDCRKLSTTAFLRGLQNLSSLVLSRNTLSEDELAPLSACVSLKELHINSLRRLTTLDWLRELKNLEVLCVADNPLGVAAMTALKSLPKLSRVQLSGSRYVSSINLWLESEQRLQSLVSLDLSKCGIESSGLNFLYRCPFLKFLDLSDCVNVTSLTFLDQSKQNSIWAPCPLEDIAYSLRWLSLSGTGMTNEGLSFISRVTHLRFLCLRECRSVSSFDCLRSLSRLMYLDLGGTQISDESLSSIESYTELVSLNLLHCENITSISKLSRMKKLRELDLSFTSVNDKGMLSLDQLSGLELLYIYSCTKISNVQALYNNSTKLKVLIGSKQRLMVGTHGRTRSMNAESNERIKERVIELRPHPPPLSTRQEAELASEEDIGEGSVSQKMKRPSTSMSGRRVPKYSEDSLVSVSPTNFERRNSFEAVTLKSGPGLFLLNLRKCDLDATTLRNSLISNRFLRLLDIRDCVVRFDWSVIKILECLTTLLASGCPVVNQDLQHIGGCLALCHLKLCGCTSITNVDGLSTLTHLRCLDLSRTNVTSEGLRGIAMCSSLHTLYLTDCPYLSDLNALSSLKFLSELHAEGTPVTSKGIEQLTQCAALVKVYFTKCNQLDDLKQLPLKCTQIEVLDTYGTVVPLRPHGQPKQFSCCLM